MGDDPDRAAILGRRNRLIALALSGIGAAAGCGDPAPCLAPLPREPTVVDEQHTGPTVPEEPAAQPVPCLAPEVRPPDEEPEAPPAEPMPCLSVAPDEVVRPAEPLPCLTPMRERE